MKSPTHNTHIVRRSGGQRTQDVYQRLIGGVSVNESVGGVELVGGIRSVGGIAGVAALALVASLSPVPVPTSDGALVLAGGVTVGVTVPEGFGFMADIKNIHKLVGVAITIQ